MKRVAIAALTVAALGTGANAIDLWVQAPIGPTQSGSPVPAWSISKGNVSGLNLVREGANDFVVGGPGWNINQLVMRGVFFDGADRNPTGGFEVSFYANNGGAPANTALSTQVSTAITRSGSQGNYVGRNAYDFTIDLTTVSLGPGTYWVSLMALDSTNFFWVVAQNLVGNEAHLRDTGPEGGGTNSYPTAWTKVSDIGGDPQDFGITIRGEVVPEPATLAAVGLGLAALAARRRRK